MRRSPGNQPQPGSAPAAMLVHGFHRLAAAAAYINRRHGPAAQTALCLPQTTPPAEAPARQKPAMEHRMRAGSPMIAACMQKHCIAGMIAQWVSPVDDCHSVNDLQILRIANSAPVRPGRPSACRRSRSRRCRTRARATGRRTRQWRHAAGSAGLQRPRPEPLLLAETDACLST